MLQIIQNLIKYDVLISNSLFNIRNIDVVNIFIVITNLVNPLMIVVLTILFILSTIFLKKKKFIIPIILSIFFASTSMVVLKNIFERPRPNLSYYIESGFSFPSGHSTMAVAFYGFIIYFLLQNIKNIKYKFIAIPILLVIILLIGFSRMYLGVHYLTDVLGGFILGGICLYSSIFIFETSVYKKRSKTIKQIESVAKVL